mmetsp:Transcript_1786/g.3267  ORF Transcript_1786/g.3267 Transcript_1786/m.3267 type:complete len:99 (-) Transcript_1786:844-1140(-)
MINPKEYVNDDIGILGQHGVTHYSSSPRTGLMRFWWVLREDDHVEYHRSAVFVVGILPSMSKFDMISGMICAFTRGNTPLTYPQTLLHVSKYFFFLYR